MSEDYSLPCEDKPSDSCETKKPHKHCQCGWPMFPGPKTGEFPRYCEYCIIEQAGGSVTRQLPTTSTGHLNSALVHESNTARRRARGARENRYRFVGATTGDGMTPRERGRLFWAAKQREKKRG